MGLDGCPAVGGPYVVFMRAEIVLRRSRMMSVEDVQAIANRLLVHDEEVVQEFVRVSAVESVGSDTVRLWYCLRDGTESVTACILAEPSTTTSVVREKVVRAILHVDPSKRRVEVVTYKAFFDALEAEVARRLRESPDGVQEEVVYVDWAGRLETRWTVGTGLVSGAVVRSKKGGFLFPDTGDGPHLHVSRVSMEFDNEDKFGKPVRVTVSSGP